MKHEETPRHTPKPLPFILATIVLVGLGLGTLIALEFPEPGVSPTEVTEAATVAPVEKPLPPPEPPRTPPDWTQSESPDAVEVCKIPDGRPQSMKTLPPGLPSLAAMGMANVGFPLSRDIIPVRGAANLVVIPGTFGDLNAIPSDPMTFLGPQLEKMTQWSEFWSQGTFRYEFQVVEQWQEVSANSMDYPIRLDFSKPAAGQNRDVTVFRRLANQVVKTVGTQVDWEATQGMLVFFPPEIDSIDQDWGGRGTEWIRTPAGEKQLFYWGGGRYHNQPSGGLSAQVKRDYLWSYWIHELIHSQGVMLHAPGNGFVTGLGQAQYPRGDNGKFSGALDAWELFMLGWIKDEQVHCVDGRDIDTDSLAILTPQEIYAGERKIIVIRTGRYEGIVVESRRPIGYSEKWGVKDSGLLIYALNLKVMNDRTGESTGADMGNNPAFDKWAYYLPPNNKAGLENSADFEDFIVKEGDTITHGGVTIELVFSDDDHDYVRITPSATD